MESLVIVYEHFDKLVTLYTYGRLGSSDVGRSSSFSFVPVAIVEGDSIRVCYGVAQVGVYNQSTWDYVVDQLKLIHVYRNYWRLPEVRGTIRDALDGLHFMPSYGSADTHPKLSPSVVQDLVRAHVMYTHLLMRLKELGDVTTSTSGRLSCGRVYVPEPLRTWGGSTLGDGSHHEERLGERLMELVGVQHVVVCH